MSALCRENGTTRKESIACRLYTKHEATHANNEATNESSALSVNTRMNQQKTCNMMRPPF